MVKIDSFSHVQCALGYSVYTVQDYLSYLYCVRMLEKQPCQHMGRFPTWLGCGFTCFILEHHHQQSASSTYKWLRVLWVCVWKIWKREFDCSQWRHVQLWCATNTTVSRWRWGTRNKWQPENNNTHTQCMKYSLVAIPDLCSCTCILCHTCTHNIKHAHTHVYTASK